MVLLVILLSMAKKVMVYLISVILTKESNGAIGETIGIT